LNTLKSWANITGFESASGIRTHKSTIDLSLKLSAVKSGEKIAVYIDFGDVGGTWGLKINDFQVDGIDFLASVPMDVTSYVKDGQNGRFE
jgi:hypothetical protein